MHYIFQFYSPLHMQNNHVGPIQRHTYAHKTPVGPINTKPL